MSIYRGACHCGRVTFEIDADLDAFSECNCSLCRRKGARTVPVHATRAVRILSGEAELTSYQFNTRTATHYFCRHCGIHPFHRPRLAPERWSVNARCLEGVDLDALPVRQFDGLHFEQAAAAYRAAQPVNTGADGGRATDGDYLRREQYADARNFDARLALHARFSTNPQGWFHWVFDHLALPPHAAVLEIGCGPGRLWSANRARVEAGWRLVLTDFSLGMLGAARGAVAGLPTRPHLAVADAQALPFAARRFDVVIANHMLYHVRDRAAALAEIGRVLAPGGRLVASTVGEQHLREIDALVRAAGGDAALSEVTAGPFTLDNGGAQLGTAFASVERDEYADALLVTETGPVLDYVRSMTPGRPLSDAAMAEMRNRVDAAIRSTGAFRVTKSTGLFVARQPRR